MADAKLDHAVSFTDREIRTLINWLAATEEDYTNKVQENYEIERNRPLGYEIINLGSDRPVQLDRVITLLEQQLGRRAHLEYRPSHPTDLEATWASIGRTHRLLGRVPQTSLEEGLQAAVAWYNHNRAWASQLQLGDDLVLATSRS